MEAIVIPLMVLVICAFIIWATIENESELKSIYKTKGLEWCIDALATANDKTTKIALKQAIRELQG